MARLSHLTRFWLAFGLWLCGIVVFPLIGYWNMAEMRKTADDRLIGEAGRSASQLAALLSLPAWELDEITARTIVMGAMEDERIYAIKVEGKDGVLEGQRRNYLWEPVPWDDEIADNCVKGMNALKLDGRTVGTVEVWLSPRQSQEELALIGRIEIWRVILEASLWTGAFLLLFWYWGDFSRWKRMLSARMGSQKQESSSPEKIVLGLSKNSEQAEDKGDTPEDEAGAFDAELGRKYQRRHSDSWNIFTALFRQVFVRAPSLMNRLYAAAEFAALCRLGQMLERIAPCLGAERLAQSAKKMQDALNDPDNLAQALAVEECSRDLRDLLAELEGSQLQAGKPAGQDEGAVPAAEQNSPGNE